MSLLSPGQTNGPVNMSVTFTLSVYGAGVLVAVLPALDVCSPLRQRIVDAQSQAEQAGTPTFQMTLTSLEAGLCMGALGPIACRFCGMVRANLQAAVAQQLTSLGVTQAG